MFSLLAVALAASIIAPAAPAEVAGHAHQVRLPANSVVDLEIVEPVSSKTSKPGDFFKLRVAHTVEVDGHVVIPEGAPAMGQVVHADRARGGGKPGELIVSARYIDAPAGRIGLRASFGAAGQDRGNAALTASIAIGPFALFVHGREVELPPGRLLGARLANDFIVPVAETAAAPSPTVENRNE